MQPAKADHTESEPAERDVITDLIDSAEPLSVGAAEEREKPSGPRAVSLGDFLDADRPPRRDHIGGILPYCGKLTFSGPAKSGKTFWASETACVLASGDCVFLGLQFGPPVPVLVIQPELSDALMAERKKLILDTAPDFVDRDRVRRNLFIWENDGGRPNLYPPGRYDVEAEIARLKPKVIVIDPLYMSFPGLRENDADQMALALDYLSEVTLRYEVAVILVHHQGKDQSAGPRGSSVFSGWGESDLRMTPVHGKPDLVRVDALLRCSDGRGFPAIWRTRTDGGVWFSLADSEPVEESAPGRKPKVSVDDVVRIVGAQAAPIPRTDLLAEVADEAECSERTAERRLKEACDSGRIRSEEDGYVLAD